MDIIIIAGYIESSMIPSSVFFLVSESEAFEKLIKPNAHKDRGYIKHPVHGSQAPIHVDNVITVMN